MTSARRAFRRRTTSVRVVAGRSFLVARRVSSPSSEARLRLGSGAGADTFAPRLRVAVVICQGLGDSFLQLARRRRGGRQSIDILRARFVWLPLGNEEVRIVGLRVAALR